ncbi:MAG: hypothetical protein HIU82_18825 [Proteobacteria bacterium]|nr:hypothetical protein [Pseudomonadota bacterium]
MTRANILVFEPDSTGHQIEAIHHILAGLEQQVPGVNVVLLTSAEAQAHPNCRKLAQDFGHLMTVRIAPMPTRSSRVFRTLGAYMHSQWLNAERLSAGLREIGPDNIDFVLIPHMESVGLVQLALRPTLCGGKPWATLAATLRFHLRQAGVRAPFRWLDLLYRALFHSVLRHPRLICFASFDPYLQQTIRHSRIVYCPVHGEPPPRSPVADARRFYGIRPESRVVLVYGFLDYRKSIDVLLVL